MAGQRQQGWPVAACWEDDVADAARQALCRRSAEFAGMLPDCAVRRAPVVGIGRLVGLYRDICRGVARVALVIAASHAQQTLGDCGVGRLPLYSVT